MSKLNIPKIRFQTQHLVGSKMTNPAEVVSWMGAVQTQQAKMAMMTVAIRMQKGSTEDVVDALNQGTILRAHILRPTWHLVAAEDIQWMYELSRDYLHRTCMQYLISYKYRYNVLRKKDEWKTYSNNDILQPVLLDKGKVIGNWKQEETKVTKTLWT
ncbi:DNA glycosylase AlkZ-like family protein [Phocaeicola oris]|uniref:DNA glycosylase AlkZ-like family protein n=1 Tax=Phocaeicola oris TaxID=2896850 RepID=UPI00234F0DCC|nr:crosslink repair DNA glycosylase YcaQ family protein [Phocaeicola oris]MCE2615325.1 winged helix DNA-binding domain-containing protein [Phocaeicola oris]